MQKLPSNATAAHKDLCQGLLDLDQGHLFQNWPDGDDKKEDKERFLNQVAGLEGIYPGGLKAYHQNAKTLLKESREGVNPFDGYVPSVPDGETVLFDDAVKFEEYEEAGLKQFEFAAVVLVAGGLGERLGYSGIKLELPIDISCEITYLEYYCRWIQAIQTRLSLPAGTIPFVLMTSDDTHAKTEALLARNGGFGLPEGQLRIVKQEKIPSLNDNEGHFVTTEGDMFELETKPHGHGDVHTLLHTSGLAKQWKESGKKWVCFIQDTNTPNFRCLIPTLAISEAKGFAVNSIATVRKPKEAIGAICHLEHKSKPPMTINVEYNQLDPLLRAVARDRGEEEKGDVGDATGNSPYPGNVNVLVFAVGPYVDALQSSGGLVPEFINPKYTDSTKTAFKKPTRLECMMQDFPKLLPASAKVGFTCFDFRQLCFAPCKNNMSDAAAKSKEGLEADSASTAEHNSYMVQCKFLMRVGVQISILTEPPVFGGIAVERYPRVSLLPHFAVTRAEMRRRFPMAAQCHISATSTLVLDGDITLEHLDLDGTLIIRACEGAKVVVKSLTVRNAGWPFVPLGGAPVPEYLAIRGYRVDRNVERRGQRILCYTTPGEYVVEE